MTSRHLAIPMLILGLTLTAGTPTTAQAQATPASPPTQKSGVRQAIPFRGQIHTVDHTAKTLTLTGKEPRRVLHLVPSSKIIADGQSATLDRAKTGEEVGGQIVRRDDGVLEVVSIRIGPKPEAKPKPARGSRKSATQN